MKEQGQKQPPTNCGNATGALDQSVLGALVESDAALHGSDHGKDALGKILKGVLLLGFERARIFVTSSDDTLLNVVAHVGIDGNFNAAPHPMPDSLRALFDGPGARRLKSDDSPPDFQHLMAAAGIGECACAPFFHKGHLIGFIMADAGPSGHGVTDEVLPLLSMFASQAGRALENSLVAEVDERLRNLRSILNIYASISSSLQLDNILKTACRSSVEIIGIDGCWLMLFSPDFKKGTIRASYPKGGMLRGTEVEFGGGPIAETVIRGKSPLVVPNVEAAGGLGTLRDALLEGGVRSSLMVPVVCKGKVIGIFALNSLGGPRHFTEEEIALCRVVAAQLAVAVDSAQLYTEVERRANQLEALRKTSLAVTSARGRDELLHTIMVEAVKLIGGKGCGIYEYHPERGELTIIADYYRPNYVGMTLRVGQGLSGQLVSGDRPYIAVPNYNEWEGKADIDWPEPPEGAVLGVPLRWAGKIIGALYINDEVGRRFGETDAHLLSLFGEQVAVALVNSNIAGREEEKLRRLELVYKDAEQFMSPLDSKTVDERLALIAKCATEVLAARACAVFLASGDGHLELKALHEQGAGSPADGRRPSGLAALGGDFITRAASADKAVNLAGRELLSLLAGGQSGDNATADDPPASLLALPLKRGIGQETKVLGLLCVVDKLDEQGRAHPARRFKVEDEWSLQILAEATCITVENAGLLEQLSEQRARLLEQRRQLNDLISNLPGGVVIVNMKGGVDMFSQRALQIMRYSNGEGFPKRASQLYFDPEDARRIGDKVFKHASDGLLRYQTFAKGGDGQAVPVRLHVTAMRGADGRHIGSFGYFEDLSSNDQTKLLLEASGAVAQAARLEDGLQDLASMLLSLLSSSFCRIMLLDKSGKHLRVEAAQFASREGGGTSWETQRGRRFSLDEYRGLDRFFRRGRPVVVRARHRKAGRPLETLAEHLSLDWPIQSLLLVPLKVGDKVFGLLDVGELRKEERSPFTPDRIALAYGIAEQVSVLIDRWRLQEVKNRRERLLEALAERIPHMRGDMEPFKLLKECVRHAAALIGYKVACLFEYHANLEVLSPPIVNNDPRWPAPSAEWLESAESLALAVASGNRKAVAVGDDSDYGDRDLVLRDGYKTVFAVPLKSPGGEIEAVLIVADDRADPAWTDLELEALEKFAQVTSIALQTASAMDSRRRMFRHLKLLHEIYGYIQERQSIEKGIDALMTGITAHYGLGLNRAVMLELEDNVLSGVKGIGHLTHKETVDAWEKDKSHKIDDFWTYAGQRESGREFPTPLGALIQDFRYEVSDQAGDAFSSIVHDRKARTLGEAELDKLPEDFRRIFRPVSQVALVPMTARGRVTGIIVADMIGTRSPIMPGELEALQTFANTAAVAIDNIKLYKRLKAGSEYLRTLFEASNALVAPSNPKDILDNIAAKILNVTQAKWARIILLDEADRARTIASKGCEDGTSIDMIVRPRGITMYVVNSGKARFIANTHEMRDELNPNLIGPSPESLLCLPLPVKGKRPGAVWIAYPSLRKLRNSEIAALQLYVNQAANAYDSASRLEVLEHMHKAAESMARTSRLEKSVLKLIVKSARAVLRADSAALWPYDSSRSRFIPDGLVTDGVAEELIPELLGSEPQPGGVAYAVLDEGALVVDDVSDPETDRYIGDSTRDMLAKLGVRSFLGLPLLVSDERFGVLYVNYNEPRSFAPEELKTAHTLANHAGLASKRTKLFEQLNLAKRTASVVAQVTALGELKQSLLSVAKGTRDALKCDVVTLYTYDAARGDFDYPPVMVGVNDEGAVVALGRVTDASVVRALINERDIYVASDTQNNPLLGREFARREGIASTVAIPLRAGDQPVGVMFVNYRDPHRFGSDERESIDLFARQAVVAIHNAQLYEQAQRRAGRLQVLHEAGQAITSRLDLNEILNRIAIYAWRIANYRSVRQGGFVDIKRIEGQTVHLAASHPPDEVERIKAVLGESPKVGRGIVGRVVRTGKAERVNDVHNDPDYFTTHDETKSQIVVPLKRADEVIGVINVEHPELNAFDEEAVRVLEALASQAGIAIENARQYEELDRTKTQAAAHTALAWMGMASSAWGHSIQGYATTIEGEVGLLRGEKPTGAAARLNKIERLAKMIREKPITSPLSPTAGVKVLPLTDWVAERVAKLQEYEPYRRVVLRFSRSPACAPAVRINPEWLRQVFDLLIDNAVNAMSGSPVRRVTVTTTAEGDQAKISVADTGPGIPDDVLPKLFRMQIPKGEGDKGLGMGLLMARIIIQAFGGDIEIGSTGSAGTEMIVRIPLSNITKAGDDERHEELPAR